MADSLGFADVDGMRHSLTPDEFNKWIAFRQICPDRLERLIHICKYGFAMLANAWGAKIEASDLDPQPEDKSDREASPQQAAMIAASMLGKPHGNSNR